MKKRNEVIKIKDNNNQGFSLIELIISITVLVLVMLPLMNNFYRSMQMNKRAEDIQTQSNLAASIMEGLKNYNMEDTIDQFTGVDPFDIIIGASGTPIAASKIKVLQYNGTSYEEMPLSEYATLDEQATFYFAMNGIMEGGTAYDAIIKMDSNTTKYKPATSTMNNYPMPDAINLDVMANSLLFSNGKEDTDTFDDIALTTFKEMGEVYAEQLFKNSPVFLNYLVDLDQWTNDYQVALMEGTTLPVEPVEPSFNSAAYPDYTDVNTLKKKIYKTMKVIVNQDTLHNVEYQINYECNWPIGCTIEKDLQYPVATYSYANPIENIYLFYRPSIFKDITMLHQDYIEIVNQTSSLSINFYVAKQKVVPVVPPVTEAWPDVTISKSSEDDITAADISVFTNLPDLNVKLMVGGIETSAINTENIVKTKAKDRIYEANVIIYEHINGTISEKYKKALYTLKSTREQ